MFEPSRIKLMLTNTVYDKVLSHEDCSFNPPTTAEKLSPKIAFCKMLIEDVFQMKSIQKTIDRKNQWLVAYRENRDEFDDLCQILSPFIKDVSVSVGLCNYLVTDLVEELITHVEELDELYDEAGFILPEEYLWDEESLLEWRNSKLVECGDDEYSQDDYDVEDEISNTHSYIRDWVKIYGERISDLDRVFEDQEGLEGTGASQIVMNFTLLWRKLTDVALGI